MFKISEIGRPLKGSSEVHLLGISIVSVIGDKIRKARRLIQ